MQDAILFDELTHFDRERVPERVVSYLLKEQF
jgi:catalase